MPVIAPSFDSSTSHVPTSSITASHFATPDVYPLTSHLGKRALDQTNIGCERIRKRGRESLSERSTSQHSEFPSPLAIAAGCNLRLPSFRDLHTACSVPEAIIPLPSRSDNSRSNSTNSYTPTSVTLGHPAHVQAHLADLTVQGNLSSEQATACLAPISKFRLPSPKNPSISPPRSSMHFQCESSNDISSFPRLTTTNLSSLEDSLAPSSALEGITSPSISEFSAASTEECDIGAEPDSWSIRHYSQVKMDVDIVPPLHLRSPICCLKFSKDGKYLAAGFRGNGTTNIYDVETGEKTWSVCDGFLYRGITD